MNIKHDLKKRRTRTILLLFMTSLSLIMGGLSSSQAGTLDDVQNRGYLSCGVSTGVPGFSFSDANGRWQGIDVDICRAIAAAVFSDAEKVEFVPLDEDKAYISLQTGQVDVLVSASGWTLSADSALGLRFVGASYFGEHGFLASASLEAKTVADINNPVVCLEDEKVLRYSLGQHFPKDTVDDQKGYSTKMFTSPAQAAKAFDDGRCDLLFGMKASLQGLRQFMTKPSDAIFIPGASTREVRGPVVRQGDENWFSIVRWTLFTLFKAEEHDVRSSTVGDMVVNGGQDIEMVLGGTGSSGLSLGLGREWMYQIVSQVGNYSEIFERNLGKESPLFLNRGRNKLWMDGGLHFSPALR